MPRPVLPDGSGYSVKHMSANKYSTLRYAPNADQKRSLPSRRYRMASTGSVSTSEAIGHKPSACIN